MDMRFLNGHIVDACRPFVCLYSFEGSIQVSSVQYLLQLLRLYTVPFLPYLSELPARSRIFFVFRTILLRAALFCEVFCHVRSFLLFPVVPGTSAHSALHLPAAMASADFCTFSVAFRSRLFLSEHSVQTSPGTTRFFPPSACRICHRLFRAATGLWPGSRPYPKRQPVYGFCSSGRRFAAGFLQIPPHDGHLCLWLYLSRCRADSGLPPVRNVRRRAHLQQRSCRTPAAAPFPREREFWGM